MELAEYQRHITRFPIPNIAWCGAKLFRHDKAFSSLDDAIDFAENNSRYVSCPECANAVAKFLKGEE